MISLAQTGKITMLVEHFPLDDAARAYDLLHHGKIQAARSSRPAIDAPLAVALTANIPLTHRISGRSFAPVAAGRSWVP